MSVQTLLQFVDQYYTFCPQSMTDNNNNKSKSDLDDAICKTPIPDINGFSKNDSMGGFVSTFL